jgi:hypothetical protein
MKKENWIFVNVNLGRFGNEWNEVEVVDYDKEEVKDKVMEGFYNCLSEDDWEYFGSIVNRSVEELKNNVENCRDEYLEGSVEEGIFCINLEDYMWCGIWGVGNEEDRKRVWDRWILG